MRAAWIEALDRPLRSGERPAPKPGPGQVVVAVRAAGVCHTDLHLRAGVPAAPALPLVPGHEVAGDVVAAGSDVDIAVGTRVLVYYYDGCGTCPACRDGLENLCPAPRAKYGFDTDGGYAERMLVAARCCVPLPDTVAYADAAVMGCSGTTALHAGRRVAGVRAGETVVVLGVGGIGLAVTQAAVLDGASVVAVDVHEASLEVAKQVGATEVVHATPGTDVARAVTALTGGADVAIDTVGSAETPGTCVGLLRTGGRLVLIGYTGRPAPLDVARVVTGEIVVRGSVGATLADAREAVRLLAAGHLRAVISARHPLAEADQALSALAGGTAVGRIVLEP
ncbi:MAG TPA: alcohol dehydrogenase catalytic domain-containing protein [Actinophytocola sp.]|nr:alcohol dehydrogenase catalytic domain-containing protein [Actinophytocola sp.]